MGSGVTVTHLPLEQVTQGSNPCSPTLRQAQCKPGFPMNSQPWYVYLLLCDQKVFYIGISDDIIGRLKTHENKESIFTRKFSELKLIYCEKYSDKQQAVMREKQLKGWSRAKKQMLIDGKLGINKCTEFDEVIA